MGAYENPITAIDRESGKIVANVITNLGIQTANASKAKAAREAKDLKDSQAIQAKTSIRQAQNEDLIANRIEKAGGASETFYNMTNRAITEKTELEMKLLGGTQEEAEDWNKQLSKTKNMLRSATNTIRKFNTFGPEYLASQTGTNEANGRYLGSNEEGASKFARDTYDNNQKMLALLDIRFDSNGDGLLTEAEYSFNDQGQVMADLGEEYGLVNVDELMNQPPIIIEDIDANLTGLFAKQGFTKNGKPGEVYENKWYNIEEQSTETIKDKDGNEYSLTTTPLKKQTQEQWLSAVELQAKGMLGALKGDKRSYDNLNATFMTFQCIGATEEKPCDQKPFQEMDADNPGNNGAYIPTSGDKDSDEERFIEAYTVYAEKNFLNNKKITQTAGITQKEKDAIKQKNIPKFVKMNEGSKAKRNKTFELFNKGFKNNDFDFMKGKNFNGQKVFDIKQDSTGKPKFVTKDGTVLGYPDLSKTTEVEEMIESYINGKYADVGQSQRNAMKKNIMKDFGEFRADQQEVAGINPRKPLPIRKK